MVDRSEAVMIPGLLVGRVLLDRLGRQGTQKAASEVAAVSQRCHRRRRPCMGSNPYEFDEMVNRLGGKSVRHISSRKSSAIELERDGAWFAYYEIILSWNCPIRFLQHYSRTCHCSSRVTVYRFPPIRIGVLLARAKFIQTMGSVCFVPYMFLQYVKDSISLANFMGAIGLALSATILLLLYSRYFNRLIGVIAMTESNQFARFGYLSFWGSRRNRVVEVKDVMSLSEANTNFKDSVLKIRQYSTSAYLFLPRQKVIIEDEDRAKLLFGDISVFNLTKKTE